MWSLVLAFLLNRLFSVNYFVFILEYGYMFSVRNKAQCSGLPALQYWPQLCSRAPGLEASSLALGPSEHTVQER